MLNEKYHGSTFEMFADKVIHNKLLVLYKEFYLRYHHQNFDRINCMREMVLSSCLYIWEWYLIDYFQQLKKWADDCVN